MSTIGNRIRARREALGMSQDELAQKLQYRSRSSVNKIELDQRELPQSKIKAIADALSTTPAYIMGWDSASNPSPDRDVFTLPGIRPVPKMVRKPLIGTVACGTPILAEQNIDKYVAVPEEIPCDFVLRCEDDSMIGAHILPGAAVYIREQPDVENGEIAAVIADGKTVLKRVYKTDDALMLAAENPAYAPIVAVGEPLHMHIRILGRAAAWTNYG